MQKATMYPIQNMEPCFFAGTTRDDQQVLMGLIYPELIAIFFDTLGNLLKLEARALPFEAPLHPVSGRRRVYDAHFEEQYQMLLQKWQVDIGFIAGTISVCHFFINDRQIGIEDMPEHFQTFLANPDEVAENEAHKQEMVQMIHDWRQDQMFVLWWDKDYYIDGRGEIDST